MLKAENGEHVEEELEQKYREKSDSNPAMIIMISAGIITLLSAVSLGYCLKSMNTKQVQYNNVQDVEMNQQRRRVENVDQEAVPHTERALNGERRSAEYEE